MAGHTWWEEHREQSVIVGKHVYICGVASGIIFDGCFSAGCVAGEGGAVREHKTSFHAISRVIRSEGVLGLYNG